MTAIYVLVAVMLALYVYQVYFRKDYDELDRKGNYVHHKRRKKDRHIF